MWRPLRRRRQDALLGRVASMTLRRGAAAGPLKKQSEAASVCCAAVCARARRAQAVIKEESERLHAQFLQCLVSSTGQPASSDAGAYEDQVRSTPPFSCLLCPPLFRSRQRSLSLHGQLGSRGRGLSCRARTTVLCARLHPRPQVRNLLGTNSYELFTLDKLLSRIAKHLQLMVTGARASRPRRSLAPLAHLPPILPNPTACSSVPRSESLRARPVASRAVCDVLHVCCAACAVRRVLCRRLDAQAVGHVPVRERARRGRVGHHVPHQLPHGAGRHVLPHRVQVRL